MLTTQADNWAGYMCTRINMSACIYDKQIGYSIRKSWPNSNDTFPSHFPSFRTLISVKNSSVSYQKEQNWTAASNSRIYKMKFMIYLSAFDHLSKSPFNVTNNSNRIDSLTEANEMGFSAWYNNGKIWNEYVIEKRLMWVSSVTDWKCTCKKNGESSEMHSHGMTFKMKEEEEEETTLQLLSNLHHTVITSTKLECIKCMKWMFKNIPNIFSYDDCFHWKIHVNLWFQVLRLIRPRNVNTIHTFRPKTIMKSERIVHTRSMQSMPKLKHFAQYFRHYKTAATWNLQNVGSNFVHVVWVIANCHLIFKEKRKKKKEK